MARDWAELPSELIESISKRLTIYADYLRFRSVCPKWRSSVPKTPLHLPPQCPFLIFSPSTFFDISTTKTHHLPLNLPPSLIYGSSYGWLVTLDANPQMCLINPFTRVSISLPDVDIFDIVQQMSLRNPQGSRFFQIRRSPFHIKKVVLSSDPSRNGNFVAFALVREHYLAFCKKGFDSWGLVYGELYSWEDIVHHEENGLFYAVSKGGTIAVCDVESSIEPQIKIVKTVAPGKFSGDIDYAVFSGNDLLLVTRVLNRWLPDAGGEPNRFYRTVWFEVFKMDWEGLKWDKIDTLGNKVLFVGRNSSLSFSASDFGGWCEADCIYFTDDYYESNHNISCTKHDVGKFRLQDQSIEPLPCDPQNSYSGLGLPLPIWLTPNPC